MTSWLERQDAEIERWGRLGGYGHEAAAQAVEKNLHNAMPYIDGGDVSAWLAEKTRSVPSGHMKVHFGDLTDPLNSFIGASTAAVGCVAWLTDVRILTALSKIQSALVVQKEDFLRPDINSDNDWKAKLRQNYGRLHNEFERHMFPAPLSDMNQLGDPTLDPVRCVGNHNSKKNAAMPRMHHKFLVRVSRLKRSEPLRATAVWTGSFNFSANAGRSFENAVEIHDPVVAEAYLAEFSRVASLSEPLNWQYDWVTPQYRLGT